MSTVIQRNRLRSTRAKVAWTARRRRAELIASDWYDRIDWKKTTDKDFKKGFVILKAGSRVRLDVHRDIKKVLASKPR